mmetsp:Transcript_44662/g.124539  ORF Transcript_44662/g.124539 Transcript_44662/m.124539 type:complete len:279 (+) Transcript_44662:1050-1886(+)
MRDAHARHPALHLAVRAAPRLVRQQPALAAAKGGNLRGQLPVVLPAHSRPGGAPHLAKRLGGPHVLVATPNQGVLRWQQHHAVPRAPAKPGPQPQRVRRWPQTGGGRVVGGGLAPQQARRLARQEDHRVVLAGQGELADLAVWQLQLHQRGATSSLRRRRHEGQHQARVRVQAQRLQRLRVGVGARGRLRLLVVPLRRDCAAEPLDVPEPEPNLPEVAVAQVGQHVDRVDAVLSEGLREVGKPGLLHPLLQPCLGARLFRAAGRAELFVQADMLQVRA